MGYGETKKKKRRVKESDEGIVSILKASFVGACVSLGSAIALWIGATAVAYAQSDPDAVMPILALCAVYAASFFGGFASSKLWREQGIVCALLSGMMLSFVLLFVSVFAKNAYSSGYGVVEALLLRAAVVGVSVFGGLVGRYKRQKRRYGKR